MYIFSIILCYFYRFATYLRAQIFARTHTTLSYYWKRLVSWKTSVNNSINSTRNQYFFHETCTIGYSTHRAMYQLIHAITQFSWNINFLIAGYYISDNGILICGLYVSCSTTNMYMGFVFSPAFLNLKIPAQHLVFSSL